MNATTEKPAIRMEIDRLMADRGIDLEELHRRFVEGGYGSVDRYDRNISLWRFAQHANGETGAINDRFVEGLVRALKLMPEEKMELLKAYAADISGR